MQIPTVVLVGQGLVAGEQVNDDLDALGQQPPGLALIEADHGRVGRERTGSQPEHEPASGQVVEQHRSLRHPQGVVIAHAHHTGTKLDVASALGGGGDEDLWRGDDLRTGRVMLSDPRFVPAQPIKMGDQFEVALDRQGGILPGRVERRHEDPETESI